MPRPFACSSIVIGGYSLAFSGDQLRFNGVALDSGQYIPGNRVFDPITITGAGYGMSYTDTGVSFLYEGVDYPIVRLFNGQCHKFQIGQTSIPTFNWNTNTFDNIDVVVNPSMYVLGDFYSYGATYLGESQQLSTISGPLQVNFLGLSFIDLSGSKFHINTTGGRRAIDVNARLLSGNWTTTTTPTGANSLVNLQYLNSGIRRNKAVSKAVNFGVDYTLTTGDVIPNLFILNSTSIGNIRVPTGAFTLGDEIRFVHRGIAPTTVSPSGTSVESIDGNLKISAYGQASLFYIDEDSWLLVGDLES